ncbi:MAG TPA: adenylate/guanylate cyclase domain-containing protein [Candidatus Limnocylindria bacterium]|nr:adenylate/guanylate cyclase domain-containing protein [Candidatus Limnocylindria bacterium]
MTGQSLPSGTLTFVFTDIEGSTKHLNTLGTDRWDEVLAVHTRALRHAFADGGTEVRIEGDALFVVFHSAAKAVRAAAAAQRALAAASFPHDAVVRVRMGMHTGLGTPASEEAGADYVGIDVHRAARIANIAHGGQVLVSGATATLAGQDLGDGLALRDLGEHRLKDLAQPEHVYQLVVAGLLCDFPPLRSLDRTPNNLPTELTTFVGRGPEIRDGLRLLDGTRLLTLTGPGGTGKTRLSLQLAAEAAVGFPDGAFWIPLAPISDPELVPSTIAHALGVHVGGKEVPLERVIEHVRGKRMLLVLDNFEQILPAAPSVSALLASGPDLKVITSSRAPLRISGEQEFPVPPLHLPDPERSPSLDALAQSDAVRLFVERARAVKPDFMVTAENAAAVAEICYRLDGLPLGIELAAARVKLLSPQAMLPRLRKGLDLLASSSPDRADRQRTLRGAIAWSYDLLDDGLRRLFARGGVFVAGAMLEQLESVCGPAGEIGGEVLDRLSELLDNSLIRQLEADGEPRFRMLVTIREFAMERLDASAEAQDIRRRHFAAYLALAERAAPELQGKDQRRWLDLLELEHDNMRGALECALLDRRVDDATRLVFALWRFWQARGYLREGLTWAERLLALPASDPRVRLRALEAAGGITYWMGDMSATERYYGEEYDLAGRLHDEPERAKAAYNLSFVYLFSRTDLARAEALLEEALPIHRKLGDRASIGRAAWALGALYGESFERSREDRLKAQRLAHEALEQHRALGNRFDIAWDLHSTGLAALRLDKPDEAVEEWREALDIFVEAGDSSGMVLLLSNFAEHARALGDLEREATLVGAWTAMADRTGVGLASLWGTTEGRTLAKDIPAERRPALERGRAMKTDEAIAYALALQPARKA